MHIGALLLADAGALVDESGGLKLAEIRARMDRRIGRVPRLRQLVRPPGPLAGAPIWIDDPNFAIERHVNALSVPQPGEEAQLLAVVEQLMVPLLDRSRPLWAMWFLTGLASGQVAVVFKLHHAIADGLAAIALLGSLLDAEADAEAVDDGGEEVISATSPGYRELLTDNLRHRRAALARELWAWRHPISRGTRVARALSAARRTAAAGRGAPRTSLNAPVGAARRLSLVRLDLTEVKAVAHGCEATVNDVLLGIVASGLRVVLLARGESVDGISLRVAMATSLRSFAQSSQLGNAVGQTVVPLPVDEPDATVRLQRIAAASRKAKHEQHATVDLRVMAWLSRTRLATAYFRHQRLVNIFETSLIGPRDPVYLLGTRVRDIIPVTAVAGNVTASFCGFSYDGQIVLAAQLDARSWPDADTLGEAMAAGWSELRSQVRMRRVAS